MSKLQSFYIFFAICCFCLSGCSFEWDNTETPKERVIRVFKFEEQSTQAMEMLKENEKKTIYSTNVPLNARWIVDQFVDKKFKLIAEAMQSQEVIDELAYSYIDSFNEEELDDILDFFETDSGQKYLNSMNDLTAVPMQVMQKHIKKNMKRLMEIHKEFDRNMEQYRISNSDLN